MPTGVSREKGRGRIHPPMEFETDDVIHSSPVKSQIVRLRLRRLLQIHLNLV